MVSNFAPGERKSLEKYICDSADSILSCLQTHICPEEYICNRARFVQICRKID